MERVEGGNVLIRGGRVVDPASAVDYVTDILVEDGVISQVGRVSNVPSSLPVVDARGMLVLPGLVDMHVHLREPGDEESENLESGLRAALAGGVTKVLCMPNTSPPLDDPKLVGTLGAKAKHLSLAGLLVAAACTEGRKGRKVSDMKALADAGAVAFTDDGDFIEDERVLEEVCSVAKEIGVPVLMHCEVTGHYPRGVMNDGEVARRLGVPGMPREAEIEAVGMALRVAARTGVHLHVMHVSAAETVDAIAEARRRGVRVTAEVTPHHLLLTEEDAASLDPDFKMNPPLRTTADREALQEALRDGTIECIATDHAPHSPSAKGTSFRDAPFGVIGLETSLAVVFSELVDGGGLDVVKAIASMSFKPAQVLGLNAGTLAEGQVADIVVFDPSVRWRVDVDGFFSRSRNCPFKGRWLRGKVQRVFVGGVERFPFGDDRG